MTAIFLNRKINGVRNNGQQQPLWLHSTDWLLNRWLTLKLKICSKWHTTRRTCINDCTFIFKAPIMSNYCPLMLWLLSPYVRTKFSPFSNLQHQLWLPDCLLLQHAFFKMENPLFTLHLDELFNMWNNALCQMNYWVHTAGRYRSTSILEKVLNSFFNYYQFHAMANMPDEIILARMMTALDLKFERALYYHDQGYDSNNNYWLPSHITRPVHIYSMF